MHPFNRWLFSSIVVLSACAMGAAPSNYSMEDFAKVRKLDALARRRGQPLAQLALAWVLRHPGMTSALVGASRVSQIEDAVGALANLEFSVAELAEIDAVVGR